MITEALPSKEAPFRTSSKSGVAGALRSSGDLRMSQLRQDEALDLVQRFFLLPEGRAPQVVVFAGVGDGNGCSEICAAVAESLAANSASKVCLVEGNFRAPGLARILGTSSQDEGFGEALQREGAITFFSRQLALANLWFLGKGNIQVPSPLSLGVNNLQRRFADLRTAFDVIVVEAPPVVTYADAVSLAQWSDGIILILEANVTRRETAEDAVRTLQRAEIPLLGAVLNNSVETLPKGVRNHL